MRKISLLVLFLCLCLGFQVQAQEVKVLSLQDKMESLTTTEQEKLEFLKRGTPQKLLVTKWNCIAYGG